MKAGIVGLPNVGKSTLFNCLSSAKAKSANFPFCTIEPNVGVVTVPDQRIIELEKIVNPEKVVPSTVEIVDIAGLVKGAHKGEGLGNQFLGNIRETNALAHVLRCFTNENITHVEGSINPIRDKEIIDSELQLKDLESLEKLLDKNRKQAKSGDKEFVEKVAIIDNLIKYVSQGKNIRGYDFDEKELLLAKDFGLITMKPVLYVCNVDEASAVSGNDYVESLKPIFEEEKAEFLILAVQTEADIAELESFEEKQMFLSELGLKEAGVDRLIKSTYKMLNLQTYFTAGKKEVRAWTIKTGWKAPQAAGVIHTDFEKGFIRAEVTAIDDFKKYKTDSELRDNGKIRVEGKEYVVQDGDIMHFRFNV